MSVHNPRPRSPIPRGSFELSRRSSHRSRTPSRNTSPMLRPVSAGLQAQGEDWQLSSSGMLRGDSQSSRDEGAYYQAETQTLTRENQMLRMRIRELGKSLNALGTLHTKLRTFRASIARGQLHVYEQPSHAVEFGRFAHRRRKRCSGARCWIIRDKRRQRLKR